MSTKAFTLDVSDGIARIGFDLKDEPVNKITSDSGSELQILLDQIQDDDAVKAVVFISDKSDTFIAGADIERFVALKTEDEARLLVESGQLLVDRFADLGKPVVAAIHGACMGGGTELSLACSYRIATEHPKTIIGLPEVQIGIIPAMGGCQRLPRLIGLRAALDIILAGKSVPGKKAARLGLVNELVHPAVLELAATTAAKKLAEGWKPKKKKPSGGLVGAFLDSTFIGRRLVYSQASKLLAKKTGGNFPAPPAALDAVRYGLSRGIRAGLEKEAEHFARLAVDDVSRELVKIFFATTALKKDPGVEGDAPDPVKVESLGVVGSGFMGAGIGATAVYKANTNVRFRDTEFDRVKTAVVSVRKSLATRLKRRQITKFEHKRLDALVSGGTEWDGFGNTDLVIEAVFEDLDVKRQVFRDLEAVSRADCILASNTSTIPIESIAAAVEHRERVIGMHFFSPVEKMPLLEVIVTPETAPWVTTSAVSYGRKMGKTVIVVKDRPGFWVNRILSPYMVEATRLVTEGVPIETIDKTMKRYGFPVGPMTLAD
ncbi:MAG: 3-hydroxyacyl-CoA dehydrogenase NAD-binding domain-containing protein, partial [Gemmatimonadota bacterium]|nr:3-hydroxyacyl-CoA dehydrogenase NAD-binding domain-containing protein [Gemmatimonadota bacterium]